MTRFFTILLTILSFHYCLAQTDFRPGYIISNSGDTVQGKIDYRGDNLMAKLCRFQLHDADSIKDYSPDDISAFRFTDSKFFVSKEIPGKGKVFMEFLIHGEVNIYYYNGEKADRYFIDKKGDKLKEIAYEEGNIHRDEGTFFHQSTKHFGLLKYYMKDTPELFEEIDGIKKPSHENLIKLAKDYHKKVCTSYDCIIYEKKLPVVNLHFQAVGGIMFINDNIVNNPFFNCGALIYIGSPRTSEKLFIKTGLLYSNISFEDENVDVIKIPFHFVYLYPKNVFRPKISYGFNFYPRQQIHTVSFATGFHLHIHDNLSFSLDVETEFAPVRDILFLPKDFFALSILPGIYWKF